MANETVTRLACLVAFAIPLSPATAPAQQADPPCGERHVVQEGESLHAIARRCDVALAELIGRNPGLGDPPAAEPGAELELGAPPEDAGAAARMDTYAVQVGDTLHSIARELELSIVELMAANPNVDPGALSIGDELQVPGNRPGGTVSLIPESGGPGDLIALRVRQLRPNDWVTVGVGPRASEWQALREARVDEGGELSTQVPVPDWAEPGQRLVFVVDTDRGLTFKSAPFRVQEGQ